MKEITLTHPIVMLLNNNTLNQSHSIQGMGYHYTIFRYSKITSYLSITSPVSEPIFFITFASSK